MLIRVDTREQHPLDFDRCAVVRDTIQTFDYAIEGDQLHFAIERKSPPDLIQSLAIQKNYVRELKKIRRARSLQKMSRIFYVIEANREDIEHFDYSIFTGE